MGEDEAKDETAQRARKSVGMLVTLTQMAHSHVTFHHTGQTVIILKHRSSAGLQFFMNY